MVDPNSFTPAMADALDRVPDGLNHA